MNLMLQDLKPGTVAMFPSGIEIFDHWINRPFQVLSNRRRAEIQWLDDWSVNSGVSPDLPVVLCPERSLVVEEEVDS
jgi:hypothetical protein